MRLTRVYHPGDLLGELQLDAAASHHLVNVLRIKQHAECIVFDGLGMEARYRVIAANKKSVELAKICELNNEAESAIGIHLCQAIAKADKMDWIIQKAVELGVTSITPMITEHSDVRLDSNRLQKKLQHWQSIIINACQQSGRAVLPEITLPGIAFLDLIQSDDLAETKIIFSPLASTALSTVPKKKHYLIAIGPEGGFSCNEVDKAKDRGFLDCSLGKRILRTETAAIAAIAHLQLLFDH